MKLRSVYPPRFVVRNRFARLQNVVIASGIKEFLKIRVLFPESFEFINYFLKFTANLKCKLGSFRVFLNRFLRILGKRFAHSVEINNSVIQKPVELFVYLFISFFSCRKSAFSFFSAFLFLFPLFTLGGEFELPPSNTEFVQIVNAGGNKHSSDDSVQERMDSDSSEFGRGNPVQKVSCSDRGFVHWVAFFFFLAGFGFFVLAGLITFALCWAISSVILYIEDLLKSIIAKIKGLRK